MQLSQEVPTMASIKPEPTDDYTQHWDGCEGVMNKDLDEAKSGNELENPFFVTVKGEPCGETSLNEGTIEQNDSTQGVDGCEDVMNEDLDESKYVSELQNPHFVTVKEELYSETLLDEDTFESSDSAQGPTANPNTSYSERFGENGKIEQRGEMQSREMGDEKSLAKNNGRSLEKDGVAGSKKKQKYPSFITTSKQITQSVSGKKTYNCDQCEKTFTEKCYLTSHMRTHTGEKPFKCDQCGKLFNQSGNLTVHMRLHTGEKPYKCSQCEKSFIQRSNLIAHMPQHTGEKPFKCNQCDRAYNERGHLTRHIRTHTGERPFQCNLCGRAFNESGHLTVHLRKHTGEKPYKCNHCGRAFNKSDHLSVHMRRRHTHERSFKCNQCERTFSKSGDLTIHMQIHKDETS